MIVRTIRAAAPGPVGELLTEAVDQADRASAPTDVEKVTESELASER